ncbi:hypothetical protein [Psychrobacillus sp. NPDC096623]|uniref:hypothetical protein n=1 Tax=Psychrobacillus sp. NPDC096623 TaxID=3364492 RepID=UPI003801AD09
MDLSNFIPEDYIPAIITASVALIAAVSAQLLNSRLTHNREMKSYLREVYENFVYEFFIDILIYADIVSMPRREHDTKRDVDINKVMDNMFRKIHYGNKQLKSLHLEYKSLKYMEDFRGDSEHITIMKTCYFFSLYSKEIFKKMGIKLAPNVEDKLIQAIKTFASLHIYSEAREYEQALNTMTSLRMFHLPTLERYSLKYFAKLVIENNQSVIEKFIEELDDDIREFLEEK